MQKTFFTSPLLSRFLLHKLQFHPNAKCPYQLSFVPNNFSTSPHRFGPTAETNAQNNGKSGNGNGNGNGQKPVTIPALAQLKAAGTPIAGLTAYDYTMAVQVDQAGVDFVLVGDSLGNVMQGHAATLPVQLDEMLYHTKIVSRGVRRALLVADMPFSCMSSVDSVVNASVRLLSEAGAAMVKLEMTSEGIGLQLQMVRALYERNIPVFVHLGLTPQSVHSLGGYRVQGNGKSARSGQQLMDQAKAAEQAGASLILLECMPGKLSGQISRAATIPVLSIGAGPECDGQLLVLPDVLGLHCGDRAPPKFVKNFLKGRDSVQAAFATYVQEVRERKFPGEEQTYH